MGLKVPTDTEGLIKVTDWTDEINHVGCKERDLAKALINLFFDVQYTEDRKLVKHYPIDSLVENTPEKLAICLESLNKVLWNTVLNKLSEDGKCNLVSCAWDERYTTQKVGKILICGPNMFSYIDKIPEDLKAYCFTYPSRFEPEKLEITSEINFTVEFY